MNQLSQSPFYTYELRKSANDLTQNLSRDETPYQQNRSKINIRSSFISPELAYSNERKKLFDKIGITKNQLNKKQQNLQSEVQNLGQSDEKQYDQNDSMFLRRKGQNDDSFYEKRLNTISKSRSKRPQNVEEAAILQSQGGIMQKLITIRKVRNQQLIGFSPKNNQNLGRHNFEFLNNINSRTANDSVMRAVDSVEADLTIQDNTFIQDCKKQNKRTESTGRCQYQNGGFMQRRQNIQQKKSAKLINISAQKFSANKYGGYQDQTFTTMVQNQNNSCIIINDFEVESLERSGGYNGNQSFRAGLKKVQLANALTKFGDLSFVPIIKGITKHNLLDLFQAKCKDLQINPSKEQMIRFFEIFQKNQSQKERKLNLVDMGLGNNSMSVVGQIIKNNTQFATLDLRKNFISNEGISTLSKYLLQNTTIVHIDVGCNQIQTEGAITLFKTLKKQKSITSLSIANTDCYKNKNKIGLKGAISLSELLAENHMIQFLNVADNGISYEGLQYLISGVKANPHLVSVNLSQNDIGTGLNLFNQILSLFSPSTIHTDRITCYSLEELVLSQNNLTNKHIEDLAQTIKNCAKTKLQRLDISFNKLTSKALLSLLQALKYNTQFKLTHLCLDKMQLEMGQSQDQVNNYNLLLKTISEYLRTNKSLISLSMNYCQIGNDIMNAIGLGLNSNEKLENLSVKGNNIYEDGLIELLKSFGNNEKLKLKTLDLSSNKLNDQSGVLLAQAIKNVEPLEQIILRDNNLRNEAGDAFQFLLQQKKNLWKVQLDLNIIKYSTLMDIDKLCKKNKRNAKRFANLPEFKQELSTLLYKKDPTVNIEAIDNQIKYQSSIIKEGQKYIINEEEFVLNCIQSSQLDLKQYEVEIKRLDKILGKLDSELDDINKVQTNIEKEWKRKIYQEESLLERCTDYKENYEKRLEKEKEKMNNRKKQIQASEEEQKLKQELEKILKEQDMLKLIMENYEKEIKRRQGNTQGDEQNERKEDNQPVNLIGFKQNTKESNLTIDEKIKDEKITVVLKDGDKQKKSKSKKRNKNIKRKSSLKVKMVSSLMCKQQHQ